MHAFNVLVMVKNEEKYRPSNPIAPSNLRSGHHLRDHKPEWQKANQRQNYVKWILIYFGD